MKKVRRLLRPSTLSLLVVAVLLASPSQAAPQIPLAAGSYKQLSLVMIAADRCGFRSFRIAGSAGSYQYLYTAGDLGSYPCISAWLKKSARRLGLKPRYPDDIYQR
jgi:hypothetical protein